MDKQEVLEFLVNRGFITDDEAANLAELSLTEINQLYDDHVIPSNSSPIDPDARFQEDWYDLDPPKTSK